ncbi:MAG: IS110 family transposase [Bacteroidota bacterium]
MLFKFFLGFDISRNTLDYNLLDPNGKSVHSGQITNSVKAIIKLIKFLTSLVDIEASSILICAEEGGLYSNFLKLAATQHKCTLWMTDALEIKLRSGRKKGKSDPADALMIANYAFRYKDQAKPFTVAPLTTRKIKYVSRQRQAIMQDVVAWKTRLGEQKKFGVIDMPQIIKMLEKYIQQAEQMIEELDKQLLELIKSDAAIKRKYDIALSVPGFGKKNTIAVFAETEIFTKIPNARACASYAGLCPYDYQSGTSIKRNARTSKACNKRLKTALHQGAQNLIKKDNLFGDQYQRLREKGKNHLKAVNAVRNKMVRVLYACLESDSMYRKSYHERLRVQ